jgi:thiamine biosynthesis protein ThiS
VHATVNGETREVPRGTTLATLLQSLGLEGSGIAVALNARVVPKAAFDRETLAEGDAVEIIRAVAGG